MSDPQVRAGSREQALEQIELLRPQVSDLAPLTEADYRRRHQRASS